MRPLRAILLEASGQDVRRCAHCAFCDSNLAPDMDVTFATLIQMVIMDDDEMPDPDRWYEEFGEPVG